MNTVTVIDKEKIASYVHVSREFMQSGMEADDFCYNQLTVMLHGFIYNAAKESGELTTSIKPPSFLDWILRRRKTVSIQYELKHLAKIADLKLPIDTIPIIQQK